MEEDRVRVCERGVKEGMDGPPARCEDGSSSGLSRTRQAHPSLAVSQDECLSARTTARVLRHRAPYAKPCLPLSGLLCSSSVHLLAFELADARAKPRPSVALLGLRLSICSSGTEVTGRVSWVCIAGESYIGVA